MEAGEREVFVPVEIKSPSIPLYQRGKGKEETMNAFIVLIILTVLFGGGGIGSIIKGVIVGQEMEAYDAYLWLGAGIIGIIIALILAIIAIFIR